MPPDDVPAWHGAYQQTLDHYTLDAQHQPVRCVPCPGGSPAHLAQRVTETDVGSACWVSTVFWGIPNVWVDGRPRLFHTRVFGGPCAGLEQHYATWEAAVAGHAQVVAQVQGAGEDAAWRGVPGLGWD